VQLWPCYVRGSVGGCAAMSLLCKNLVVGCAAMAVLCKRFSGWLCSYVLVV
jgi:hypothetical protein